MKLPKKDIMLLCQLRKNSREPLTTMSRDTAIPVSTLYDRLRHFEKNNIIKKSTILLDFSFLGYEIRVTVAMKTIKESKEELLTYLKKHQNVNNLYKINNGYDFFAEGVFKSVTEAEKFIDDLETKFEFKNIDVHYIIDDLKREGFLSDKNLISILNIS
ncbi:MAG TPA: Lrp/AsnC family transcriptional regulator [Candidatus Woesearchaeota archaeon]|nr:Lrp/AsnC family transcriptional regulator [Candidatus Woesearchaeota archaeon]